MANNGFRLNNATMQLQSTNANNNKKCNDNKAQMQT